MKKNKMLLFFALFALDLSVGCSDDEVNVEHSCYYAWAELSEDADQTDGYYLIVAEFTESAGNAVILTVDSDEFVPTVKLYYGEELIAETQGEERYDGWMASLAATVEQTGTYRLVISTTEQGNTGQFTMIVSEACCENLIESTPELEFTEDFC